MEIDPVLSNTNADCIDAIFKEMGPRKQMAYLLGIDEPEFSKSFSPAMIKRWSELLSIGGLKLVDKSMATVDPDYLKGLKTVLKAELKP